MACTDVYALFRPLAVVSQALAKIADGNGGSDLTHSTEQTVMKYQLGANFNKFVDSLINDRGLFVIDNKRSLGEATRFTAHS